MRSLAHYRLLQALPGGGQAAVYLALDTHLQRRVCIKVYQLQGQRAERRQALREAMQLTRVASPRVIAVHDVVGSGTQLALVTAYIPGCSLEALLRDGSPLPVANAIAIVSDLAVALAALRQARVVHGDLKASNVFLNRDGRAFLGDFGAARIAGQPLSALSRESLAPEQAGGDPGDLRSDLFALGLVLYRMLYRDHPFFSAGELSTAFLKRGLRRVPAIPDVDPAAEESIQSLLLSLLAVSPDARLSGTFALRERLREIRGLLPAPQRIDGQILRLMQRAPESSAPARLPSRLIRLPRQERLASWVGNYWRRGSGGARALLAAAVALPLAVACLWLASPGPCVSVSLPFINAMPVSRAALPDPVPLQQMLTSMLRSASREAMILGQGPDSDSRYTLSASGTQNACIADRSLGLRIDCFDKRCQLRMLGERGERRHEGQLRLAAAPRLGELRAALQQLVNEQSRYLFE